MRWTARPGPGAGQVTHAVASFRRATPRLQPGRLASAGKSKALGVHCKPFKDPALQLSEAQPPGKAGGLRKEEPEPPKNTRRGKEKRL